MSASDIKKISVDENLFRQLPADVQLSALLLRKLGKLEIILNTAGPVKA